jgi:hypothetical protein
VFFVVGVDICYSDLGIRKLGSDIVHNADGESRGFILRQPLSQKDIVKKFRL